MLIAVAAVLLGSQRCSYHRHTKFKPYIRKLAVVMIRIETVKEMLKQFQKNHHAIDYGVKYDYFFHQTL